MEIFKTFCMSLFFGIIIYLLEYLVGADFIREFFISILSTLLAINIAVLSIILSRMKELDPRMKNFANSKKEIWKSINEQVVLIIAALIVSIFSSKTCYVVYPELIGHTISILFITIFSYAIYILRDTAKALINSH